MDKKYIIEEIKRTATENNGVPLGKDRFYKNTGIKFSDWYGIYWPRWGDAQEEAGYKRNTKQESYSKEYIIGKLIDLIKEKNKYPTVGEIRMKSNSDSSFPSHDTFRRLGNKSELIRMIIEYCNTNEDHDDVLAICLPLDNKYIKKGQDDIKEDQKVTDIWGQVYLLKHDKHYKIGKSTDVTRRYKEIKTQMPVKMEEVHVIKTDDPSGVESYWHNRFKDKRLEGEWFNLSSADVKTFKRWRCIY